MAEVPQVSFERALPGQGLTHELGNRPWQQPPQYTTVEQALQYHIPRITHPDLQEDLMNVIETGVPLTIIAESLQSGAVMQGKHSVDVGILIIPVLMETLAYLAEELDVEYNMGTELKTEDTPSESSIAVAMSKIRKRKKAMRGLEEEETPVERVSLDVAMQQDEPMEEEAPPQTGLMARRM